MKLAGRIWKSKKSGIWLAEFALLDLVTQARTKKDLSNMIIDAIKMLVDDKKFYVQVSLHKDIVYLDAKDQKKLVALILKRQRNKNGMSIEEVSAQLHTKSTSEYLKYESGKSSLDFENFEKLLTAIDPSLQPVISCR